MHEAIENPKRVAAFFISGSSNNNLAIIVVATLLNELTLNKVNRITGQYYQQNFDVLNSLKQKSIDRLLPDKVGGDKPKQSNMEFLSIIKRMKIDNSIKDIKWLGNNEGLSQPLKLYTQDICALDPDKQSVLVTNLSLIPADHGLSAKKISHY